MQLILSSSSPARKTLLERLGVTFATYSPDIDESLQPDESVKKAVVRLAIQKAQAGSTHYPNSLVIGCDQLVTCNEQVLGKPLTHDKATEQLQCSSEQTLHSYTGLCLLNSATQAAQTHIAHYQVKFKKLSRKTIEQYLKADQPYQCAGSIKAESLGPTLFEWMRGDDPTALTGLPLIALNTMLLAEGIDVLAQQT